MRARTLPVIPGPVFRPRNLQKTGPGDEAKWDAIYCIGMLLTGLLAFAAITASTGHFVTICSSGPDIVRWNETSTPDLSNAVTLTAELRLCVAECAAGESYRVEYALATLSKAVLMLGPRLYDGLTYEALEVRRRSNVSLVMQICNSTQRLHGESVLQDALKLVSTISFSYQLNCNQWNDFCSHLHTLVGLGWSGS